ncbi:hypothetical protein [Streptomyces sp. NPDC047315]|uniref:hypothetical protein n=1 Tax=Streptomyces sp. NPDC047315 TaxID=3155142 RepID=UPI0033E216A8
MTVRTIERAATGISISADGAYAARLAGAGEALFPERWTLDGPEPYAVPLPLHQPEEPDTELLPLADGRVLVHRRAGWRQLFSLLYPTGPGTGELPLGGIESTTAGPVRLLPPAPDGRRAYALAPGESSTAIWLVAGGAAGPERVAEVPGRCSGGVWLDRTGQLLGLDRQSDGGPAKAVAVDLARAGEVSPLLQIADDSDDRLLLAAPDSGLLVVRSNAPGEDRIGWGVLGGSRPVRFPDCLRLPGRTVTPFAVQPGQVLLPESCAVAFRVDGDEGSWLGVWRPSGRRLHQRAAPEGWFAGAGRWSDAGALHVPYTNGAVPCGVAVFDAPAEAPADPPAAPPAGPAIEPTIDPSAGLAVGGPSSPLPGVSGGPAGPAPDRPAAYRPVPLQQAPLGGRKLAG